MSKMSISLFVNVTTARFIIFFFVLSVWLANAQAAGLGPIKIQSALGQPFIAEIEITTLDPADVPHIQARIASAETYEANKINYPGIVRQIRANVENVNGKTVLKLSSNAPINEPSLDLLVEFISGISRVMHKYSVLLDLPK